MVFRLSSPPSWLTHSSFESLARSTYIDHIRDVVDVVFRNDSVGCGKVQQIVVSGFCTFQLVFRVLGLSLKGWEERWRDRK